AHVVDQNASRDLNPLAGPIFGVLCCRACRSIRTLPRHSAQLKTSLMRLRTARADVQEELIIQGGHKEKRRRG
ncbi:MAG: hypothetical protein WB470_20000, partial [Candidatus Acidiferrales bacterium]